MKKTLMAILTAGIIACGVSSASKNNHPLGRYANNSYCLRTYVGVVDEEGEELTAIGYGTVFAIKQGVHTIYVTNEHVVNPESAPEIPPGFTINRVAYAIVDNKHDNNPEDDTYLEVVAIGPPDLALLKSEERKPTSIAPLCNKKAVSIGARARTNSRSLALDRLYSEGVISALEVQLSEYSKNRYTLSTVPIHFGGSGSPIYVEDQEGDLCIESIVVGMTRPECYTISIPSSAITQLLKQYVNHKTSPLPDYYEHQVVPVFAQEPDPLKEYGAEFGGTKDVDR